MRIWKAYATHAMRKFTAQIDLREKFKTTLNMAAK